jgi:hypothetical protein
MVFSIKQPFINELFDQMEFDRVRPTQKISVFFLTFPLLYQQIRYHNIVSINKCNHIKPLCISIKKPFGLMSEHHEIKQLKYEEKKHLYLSILFPLPELKSEREIKHFL